MKSNIVLCLFIVLSRPLYAREAPACPFQKVPPLRVGNYTLTITEFAENISDLQQRTDRQSTVGYRCVAEAMVNGENRREIARDWSMSWLDGSGKDLDGDGIPDVIAEGDGGGMHCNSNYTFVSLGKKPEVYFELSDVCPIVVDGRVGRSYIRGTENAFDGFDHLCHACSPFPSVTLELRGRRLRDVTTRFETVRHKDVQAEEKRWEREDGEEFAALPSYKSDWKSGYSDARAAALQIVTAYLYSGHDRQAWMALDKMWPASDRARIKNSILEARRQGILSQIAAGKPTTAPQSTTKE